MRPRDRTLDRKLARNALLTGAALASSRSPPPACRSSGDRDFGPAPRYVASHKSVKLALKIALVEPAQQAQIEGTSMLAAAPAPAASGGFKVASRFDAAFGSFDGRARHDSSQGRTSSAAACAAAQVDGRRGPAPARARGGRRRGNRAGADCASRYRATRRAVRTRCYATEQARAIAEHAGPCLAAAAGAAVNRARHVRDVLCAGDPRAAVRGGDYRLDRPFHPRRYSFFA